MHARLKIIVAPVCLTRAYTRILHYVILLYTYIIYAVFSLASKFPFISYYIFEYFFFFLFYSSLVQYIGPTGALWPFPCAVFIHDTYLINGSTGSGASAVIHPDGDEVYIGGVPGNIQYIYRAHAIDAENVCVCVCV